MRFLLEGTDTFYGDPAFTEDGQMIVGSANINDRKHLIYSADLETFAITTNWPQANVAKDTWMAGALVLDGTIYAPNSDGTLYAFDKNGTLKAEFKTQHALWSAPVSDGETIYLSSMDHFLYALDPANIEQEKWKVDLSASIIGSPVYADGKLYVGNIAGTVFAIDAATGKILWQPDLDGIISDHLAYADGRVFVGISNQGQGKVYILNAEDGSQIKEIDVQGNVLAAPLAQEGLLVFVTDTGFVTATDLDGQVIWEKQVQDDKLNGIKIYSAAVAAGDAILVAPFGNSSKMLIAYDRATGSQKWVFAPAQ
jgi:outer membrane protein assembly factor BamB